MGPWTVDVEGTKTKQYLLIITCLWSRAINLIICKDMTVQQFLRAFQLHIFSYGAPSRVYSDLGSNLVAGGNVIRDYFNDNDTRNFFSDQGVSPTTFEYYPKGCNKLGSLVESCVKIVKRLVQGTIRNLVLNSEDFQFLVAQVVHLVNRRPVAFKDALRDTCTEKEVPSPITPELLLHGRELISLNVTPGLQNVDTGDPDWNRIECPADHVRSTYDKLLKARKYLNQKDHEEFIPQLIFQATNVKDRYLPVKHNKVNVGDIVLLKEPLLKPSNYPLAIVTDVVANDVGEVTTVMARKGSNRETVKRHVESIIPLLTPDSNLNKPVSDNSTVSLSPRGEGRSKRLAAVESARAIRSLLDRGLV